ncbi:HipA domain-containing protein [Rufibacter psychrotolerans]|uniref:HipA domain-containing protein n=1 Tax=Rufibacter psychrotolerans TaxID=2812556 RepID=UPI001F07BE82|nr:HipA domain-containing protein [Rufibacter sp. SYSU D00308]
MFALAEQIIRNQTTVTGVQPKLSLSIEELRENLTSRKFAIVGLWGDYILKPQTQYYRNLPEIEDVTMHLARLAKIKTVNHSLIRLASGQLAYITKRIDRVSGKKLHMEDMCQLTERLTEQKYKGSYEQIAKVILRHAANPGFDLINFYEQVVFSFLTGNNDMHLKNFSLLKDQNQEYHLCPAYDLVASELVVEDDPEELALTLNGKKRKLKRKDFELAMQAAGIEARAVQNIFKKFAKAVVSWHSFINISFLPEDLKAKYHEMLELKLRQLEISG